MSPRRSRTADCRTCSCGRPQRRRVIAGVTTRVVRFTCARNEQHTRTSRRGYVQSRELRQSRECTRGDRGQQIDVQVPAGARSAAASLRHSRLMSSDSHVHVTSRTNARAAATTHRIVSFVLFENVPAASEDSRLSYMSLRAPAAPPHHCGSHDSCRQIHMCK